MRELTLEMFAFTGPRVCEKALGLFRMELPLGGTSRRDVDFLKQA